MNPFRTVGGRLALALLVVVGGALGIVYVLVVPLYRSSLVDARLGDLRHTAARIAARPRHAPGEVFPSAAWIEDEALPVADGARVVVFSAPPLLEPVADSNGGTSRDVEHDRLARARHRRTGSFPAPSTGAAPRMRRPPSRSGTAPRVAVPRATTRCSSWPHPSIPSSRRWRWCATGCCVAASAATAFAIVLGYALAGLFARRIRRLELAAERIAAGSFDEPVLDASRDELGQLARAFDRMRLRLASLDQARNEFIANASHELRTPLFSLAGFLELLDDEELDATTRDEFLAEMSAQVARLAKLATDLFDLSRLDAGRLTVAEDGFDLGAAGDLLVAELGPRAAAAGHILEADGCGGPHLALADEARVLQIGRILIDNALVHTPPGTRVTVGADPATAAGDLTSATTAPASPRVPRRRSSPGSSGSAARWRPAAASGSRSRESSRSSCTGTSSSRPGRAARASPWCSRWTWRRGRATSPPPAGDEIHRRNCFHPECVRPTLVVALCALAALAGAGGAIFAVESGGWNDGGAQTVLVREPLARSSLPATVVVSKPVLARGFSPRRIYATRNPGVVTVFSYFGKAANATLEEGSGLRRRPHGRRPDRGARRRLDLGRAAVGACEKRLRPVRRRRPRAGPGRRLGSLRRRRRARGRAAAPPARRPCRSEARAAWPWGNRSRRSARRSAPRPRSRSASSPAPAARSRR